MRPIPPAHPDALAATVPVHWRRYLPWFIAAALLWLGFLGFEAFRRLASELRYDEVIQAMRNTSWRDLLLACGATAVSYVALTGYDRSALRYVGAKLAYRIVGQTAFIAFALSNAIGLGLLTGGTVRLRMYGAAGVPPEDVGRVIAFNVLAFGLGIGSVGAVALLWAGPVIAPALHVPVTLVQGLAAGFLCAMAALLLASRRGGERRLFGHFTIAVPPLPLSLQQLAISAVDIVASATVLWLLLPGGTVDFPSFLGFYAVATVLGILSHLPGGIGVFEAVILLALGDHAPAGALAGALVLYRLLYYVLPLVLAVAWLVLHELRRQRRSAVMRAMIGLTPVLMAALTLVAGILLLVSGVTPPTAPLALPVPLPLLETAHFLGSIAGLMLLFVARGMLQRLDAAWWTGVLVGACGLAFALLKGVTGGEASMLAVFLALLVISRRQFTRRASLFAQPFSPGWALALAAVLASLAVLLLLAYRDVGYAHALWWQFEIDGHAPRSMRAWAAVCLLTMAWSLRTMFRPAAPAAMPVAASSVERAAVIIRAQDTADAHLALMGDKQLLFSDSGHSFVMYGRRGRSWIALFDPVGPANEAQELIWRFLEIAREAGGRAAFYQVRPDLLPYYLDAGLHLLKLGEHASVRLSDFTLAGSRRANLRQSVHRAEREGLTFEVLPLPALPGQMPILRRISDAWLGEHKASEKGFSLGAFDEAYVCRQPVAVVRRAGQVEAFATLMLTDCKVEASVDLMRHLPEAPRGTMEFLFVKLMLYFQAKDFQRFGLGMAPLSGMAGHPLAPYWHRLGRLLFAHGEHFYHFQGLRAFKEKFDPEWQPRYLATPGRAAPLFALADTAALIAGGFRALLK